jgi:hypothetical protein
MVFLYISNDVILPHFHHSFVGFGSLLMHFIEKVIEVAVVFGELSVIVNVA